MKRYYICPKAVWEQHIHLMAGSSYIHLDDAHILVNTDFKAHDAEETWHSHVDVGRFTHPQSEKAIPLSHLHTKKQHEHKQFTSQHYDLLVQNFGIDPSHTIVDLHEAIKGKYPGMKLNIY